MKPETALDVCDKCGCDVSYWLDSDMYSDVWVRKLCANCGEQEYVEITYEDDSEEIHIALKALFKAAKEAL